MLKDIREKNKINIVRVEEDAGDFALMVDGFIVGKPLGYKNAKMVKDWIEDYLNFSKICHQCGKKTV